MFPASPRYRVRDHANFFAGETSHHSAQVVRSGNDVAIVDQNVFVSRLRQHLRQRADLPIHAQALGTRNHPHRSLGKFPLQTLHQF